MIEDGLFEMFPVDSVYGMHNAPGIPVGQFACAKAVPAASISSRSRSTVWEPTPPCLTAGSTRWFPPRKLSAV